MLEIENFVEEHVQDWGIKVENMVIKDIQINQDLQATLSSAAKERRLAESKIISAKADVQSAKLMREAADILDSDAAMQIRNLEAIRLIGTSGNTKVILMAEDKE